MRVVVLLALPAFALAITPAPSNLGKWLLNAALASPLYKAVLVPSAKKTMVRTAEENGVPWRDALSWIKEQGPWQLFDLSELARAEQLIEVPEYYRQPFHAYEEGNLCWDAAWEGEIASRAVGARNFPAYGAQGEDVFRAAFDDALISIGATCPDGGKMVDLGCGTGISTRRLGLRYPQASQVLGLDLSPHFLAVGRRLLELARESPSASHTPWVQPLVRDERILLRRADAANTGLPDSSVDVVCLSLVIHELPPEATREIAAEAFRILKPGSGQLWLTEMDFATPGFSKLRANPVLFSLIRSTEPYLDVYADYQTSEIGGPTQDLRQIGFGNIRIVAATGRHFALVATRPAVGVDATSDPIDDRRKETAKSDTHLRTWQAKEE
eukprot:CAMPEP_0183332634 /NCGR_PEP_ID=MMETSP0164_2-20130417/1747_1 /TAXON_ID=221442 /ORGANISM="Coccolithus pelagicus ssp braarudi, Strain PLY182g" /LENGTH=383 /DNA_ID=CAMNT_0025501391 /DNA_START=30 /DNA_END=1181 /DNA_ORIENTATION=+